MKRTGGTLNIRGSLEEKGLYPERIEQKFRSAVETPFSSLIEKIIHTERVVKISRTEFNVVKKYYLLQKYRTPKTLIELNVKCNELEPDYYPSLEEVRLEGESDYDLWIRVLEIILDTDWKDMRKCCIPQIAQDAWVLDCMYPMILKTDSELVLPDTGIYGEYYKFDPPEGDYSKRINEIRNKQYTPEQIETMTRAASKNWLGFYCMPIHPNWALILLDNVMKTQLLLPHKKRLFESEIVSVLKYNTRIKYENKIKRPHQQHPEDIWPLQTINDQIIIHPQRIEDEIVVKMNCLAINSCNHLFVFKNLEKITVFINNYLEYVPGMGIHCHTLSYIFKIDFTKPIGVETKYGFHKNNCVHQGRSKDNRYSSD